MASENPFAAFEITTNHPELGITEERRREGYRFTLFRALGGGLAIRHYINEGRYPTSLTVHEPETPHWDSLNALYAQLSETQQDISGLFPDRWGDDYSRVAITDSPSHAPGSG
ncbi:hypothetical protein HYZ99_05690 [Candidatus Peregrinibacteria bacterium]|nr:hypothetical protein [Candidatus Peregrinibacteria bacterium]